MEEKRLKLKFSLLFFFLIVVFSLLLIRLFDIELLRGEEFFRLSEENRYFNKRDNAERAVFLDRYGDPLVKNKKLYLELLDENQLYSQKRLINYEEALSLLATSSSSVSQEFQRNYLYGESVASALGYISLVTAEDLEDNSDLFLDERLGRMGLEKYFDDLLKSKASHKKFEVNALGEKQKLVEFQEAIYGQNIGTSLDPYLSTVAYRAMDGKKGAVVIMDAHTGELLTLISSPSYDPNVFEKNYEESLKDSRVNLANDSSQKIKEYLQDENKLFFNRAISGAYPPGSVFKLVTALGALEEEALDRNTKVEDEGVLKVGDWEYANWYYTQYGRVEGTVDLIKAIARSNDIYFYKAAEWLGVDKLAYYARLFLFGETSGLELGNEVSGLVPDPKWKEEVIGEPWYLGNTYHFGIGQGDILVTPLQVAQMTQAISNHASLCSASLLSSNDNSCRDLAIQEENLNLVMEGMLAACSSGGTAYPLFKYNQIIEESLGENDLEITEKIDQGMIVCKTGTAEFGGADERGYRKTHAWTTSILGINSQNFKQVIPENDLKREWLKRVQDGNSFPQKLIITVLVESDEEKIFREGSEDAAPVIAEIVEWITN